MHHRRHTCWWVWGWCRVLCVRVQEHIHNINSSSYVLRMPPRRPNLSASSLICTASSRVGANTKAVGPARGLLRNALMCIMAGNKKPQVLPLPVLAMATKSRPDIAMGHACAWMGVGAEKPALRICDGVHMCGSCNQAQTHTKNNNQEHAGDGARNTHVAATFVHHEMMIKTHRATQRSLRDHLRAAYGHHLNVTVLAWIMKRAIPHP